MSYTNGFDEYVAKRPCFRMWDLKTNMDDPKTLVERGLTRTEMTALKDWASLSEDQIWRYRDFDPEAYLIATDAEYRKAVADLLNPPPPVKNVPKASKADISEMVRAIGRGAKDFVEAKVKELEARIAALEISDVGRERLRDVQKLGYADVVARRKMGAPEDDFAGDMERRIRALEERPAVEYKGVWQADAHYPIGSMVTHCGSVWHADVASKGIRPGDKNNLWKLAVKAVERRTK